MLWHLVASETEMNSLPAFLVNIPLSIPPLLFVGFKFCALGKLNGFQINKNSAGMFCTFYSKNNLQNSVRVFSFCPLSEEGAH